jgi:dihydroorotate dehydrogenase electron transfer subunit
MSRSSLPIFETVATVVAQENIFGAEYEITFHAPDIARHALPGQFMAILFGENYAPLLRRPFSIYRVERERGTVSVLYQARGAFTSGLATKRAGDRVELLGALGQPFLPPDVLAVRHLLVAGGFGVPPMAFLARELAAQIRAEGSVPENIIVINGARTAELLVGMTEFLAIGVTTVAVTDDGLQTRQGVVTDVLAELLDEAGLPPQIYACGPMPMIRAVRELAIQRGVACQVSVETPMPCGIGICQGCAVEVREGNGEKTYALACVDGPVFEAGNLV